MFHVHFKSGISGSAAADISLHEIGATAVAFLLSSPPEPERSSGASYLG